MSIAYEDVEVEVSQGLGGRPLEVRILQSPFDRPRELFTEPFEPEELQAFLDHWDDLVLASDPREARYRKVHAEGIGEKLYRSLFHGKVDRTFSNCLESVREHHRVTGLRIRISFGEREHFLSKVLGLPWELLYQPDTGSFLGCGPGTQVVRYLDTPRRIPPLEACPPLKVLAVLSSPRDRGSNEFAEHKLHLQEALRRNPSIELRFLEDATLTSLREQLLAHHFHVIHFIGHGGFHRDGEGLLYFEGPDGSPYGITSRELAKELAMVDSLRLMVLNPCEGMHVSRQQGDHPFTHAALELVEGGLPAVVAMQFPISRQAAFRFSSTLYSKLGEGCPVDEAVIEARLRMRADAKDPFSFEWATPALFLSVPDGTIFNFRNVTDNTQPIREAMAGTLDTFESVQQSVPGRHDGEIDRIYNKLAELHARRDAQTTPDQELKRELRATFAQLKELQLKEAEAIRATLHDSLQMPLGTGPKVLAEAKRLLGKDESPTSQD